MTMIAPQEAVGREQQGQEEEEEDVNAGRLMIGTTVHGSVVRAATTVGALVALAKGHTAVGMHRMEDRVRDQARVVVVQEEEATAETADPAGATTRTPEVPEVVLLRQQTCPGGLSGTHQQIRM
jgi:hypothetical protein